MSDGVMIRCGYCGNEEDMWWFLVDVFGKELPLGVYRCPGCGRMWRMVPLKKMREVYGRKLPVYGGAVVAGEGC